MFESHLLLMVVYAVCVGAAGGALLKDEPREQVRAGASIFGSLVGAALLAGWILYFLPL
jgi:hypothetical protein